MILAHLVHLRLCSSAVSEHIRTTVAKQATGREVEQRWHHTGDGAQLLVLTPSPENRDGLQQADGIWVFGFSKESLYIGVFH